MAFSPQRKVGYCPNCVKNVPHFRFIRNRFLRVLDFLFFFRILGMIGIGPWLCKQCFQQEMFIKPARKKAPNYKSAALGQNGTKESDAIGTWRKANVEATNIKENATPNTFEPAGNFLKTEGSLVVRSKRKVRFSEKYRDSVVGKILTGATTISKVRQDSELCEADIVNWIADKFRRTQMENEYLRSQLPEDLLSNEPVLSSTDEYSPATLTGAAKPK